MEDVLRKRLLTRTMAISGDRNINMRIFTSKVLSIARAVEKSDGANEGTLDQCIREFFTALRDLEFEGVRLYRIAEALRHDRFCIEARFKDTESTIAEKKDEISLQRVALEKAKVNRNHENVLESIRKTIAALPAASQSSQEIVQLEKEIADLESEIAENERVKALRAKQTALLLDLVEEMSEILGDDVAHRDVQKMVAEETTPKAKTALGKRDPKLKDSGNATSASSSVVSGAAPNSGGARPRTSHHTKRTRTESSKDRREPDGPPKTVVKMEDDEETEEGQVLE